ncbi:DUF6628 family protein [Qipengyuania sp. JC766]|uniref:DUF6628 family protein n=1 Tax=Qipengyuania sp. JC766 TaxID=3232139 RepID=UPI00345A9F72
MSQPSQPCALPYALPNDRVLRPTLVMLRRMAAHGLRDARATMLAIDTFGADFRKPLTLMRCYLHELATASCRNIRIAPCCAPRMTRDEALMMETIELGCAASFSALTDGGAIDRVLPTAQALQMELAACASRRAG